jgi:hypothetical protein
MLTTQGVRTLTKAPWWNLVKNEVARTITLRAKAGDLELKPHGSILGQMFVDTLNGHPECRVYVHYLITRKWPEILSDIGEELSQEVLDVVRHEEGGRWFYEFQRFLATAWKNSIDPAPPVKKEPPGFRAVIETEFFKEFLHIWAGHLKMGRPPHLLATMLVNLMLANESFEAFYNWMAASSYEEVLTAIGPKIQEEVKAYFRSSEAVAFFDEVIGVIARRIKDDYEQRGLLAH